MSTPIPRMPHPDVAIVKSVLREAKPGEIVPYEAVEKALGYSVRMAPGYSRTKTARNQLRHEGMNIVAVPGVGFLHETGEQALATHDGYERKGMCRKARKAGEKLANINPAALTQEQQYQFYAARTTNNIVYSVTGSKTQQKVLAAVKVSTSVLPMAKALEVLQNGK